MKTIFPPGKFPSFDFKILKTVIQADIESKMNPDRRSSKLNSMNSSVSERLSSSDPMAKTRSSRESGKSRLRKNSVKVI